ncbi:hypothetical protein C427_0186 [Paraglaciecola psychrophila 170]|uniref:Uncharacterized protein n=1 Tax=Paraglaciecola psychrophila 170 TaxID=1129794 RepID=K7AAX3_9ALTE|nr:hypothetical protein C427_0186 [Paraglaciecola psychrophila 170]GAC37828.1 hypothetical protein GPSY_2207 [Paraglaciecola psychrophila 170]
MAVFDRRLAIVFPPVNLHFGQYIIHQLSFNKRIISQKMSVCAAGF